MELVVLLHLLLSLLCLAVFFDVILGCGWFSFGFGVVWVLGVGAFGMVVGGVYGSWLWVTPYWVLELCGLPFAVGCFLLYFAMCFVSVVRCCTSSLLGLLCLHEVVFYGSINSVVV